MVQCIYVKNRLRLIWKLISRYSYSSRSRRLRRQPISRHINRGLSSRNLSSNRVNKNRRVNKNNRKKENNRKKKKGKKKEKKISRKKKK